MGVSFDVENKPVDFGATTAVFAYVRKRLTPKVLWSEIGTLVAVLVVSITWLVNTQSALRQLQDSSTQRQAHDEKTDALLQQLVNGQTAMNGKIDVTNGKVDALNSKVDSLANWREDIERAAESPPHARRRR